MTNPFENSDQFGSTEKSEMIISNGELIDEDEHIKFEVLRQYQY